MIEILFFFCVRLLKMFYVFFVYLCLIGWEYGNHPLNRGNILWHAIHRIISVFSNIFDSHDITWSFCLFVADSLGDCQWAKTFPISLDVWRGMGETVAEKTDIKWGMISQLLPALVLLEKYKIKIVSEKLFRKNSSCSPTKWTSQYGERNRTGKRIYPDFVV